MERRVSIDHCRKILGPYEAVSDENLATLREQLYRFAELIFDVREDRKKCSGFIETHFEQTSNFQEEREILRERAAIIEFDGKVSRDEAERMAIGLSLVNERMN